VGKATLEGLAGIPNVTSGWRWGREINTVIYDPSRITSAEMVDALKAVGTSAGIAE